MAVKLFHKVYSNDRSNDHLFILHGLFGMLDNWHNMARKLSEYYNVVVVDQRNHGKSPHTNEMSFEAMADDLAVLMNDLGVSSGFILGHSMGGKTAMKFADMYPDRVTKLVVVDIAPKQYKPGHTTYFNAFNSIDFSAFSTRKEADDALAEIESNISIRQFLLKNLEKADEGYRLKFNLAPIEAFYPKMIDKLEFSWIIPVPTLFLYGTRSGYILPDDKYDIEAVFTDCEFVGIEGAGHWVHAEKPQKFFETVLAFLQ